MDEFFYSLSIPVFNNSIQKAKEEREIMNKVVTEYTNSIAIEPAIEIETPW
jgi:cytochrome c-type biogenesis protein CcmH/NrfF